jgi:hypothetical protein
MEMAAGKGGIDTVTLGKLRRAVDKKSYTYI